MHKRAFISKFELPKSDFKNDLKKDKHNIYE